MRNRFLIATAIVFGLSICAFNGPASAQSASSAEVTFWESIKDTRNPAELEAYLKTFPSGVFVPLARIRLQALSQAGDAAQTKPAAAEPPEPVLTPSRISDTDIVRVQTVQRRLYELNFRIPSTGGKMDVSTRQAIQSWQRERGHSPTGVLTWAQFEELDKTIPPTAWAAVAVASNGEGGSIWRRTSRRTAELGATAACVRAKSGFCQIAAAHTRGCVASAAIDATIDGRQVRGARVATGENLSSARVLALQECSRIPGAQIAQCKIRHVACADGSHVEQAGGTGKAQQPAEPPHESVQIPGQHRTTAGAAKAADQADMIKRMMQGNIRIAATPPLYPTLAMDREPIDTANASVVRSVQASLRDLGHLEGGQDGVYDARTADAVAAWRRSAGRSKTGTITVWEWTRIDRASREAERTRPIDTSDSSLVRLVQQQLYDLNYNVAINGTWDRETQNAAQQVRALYKLATGTGPLTGEEWERLKNARVSANWGATAYTANGIARSAWSVRTRKEAEERALKECRARIIDPRASCQVMAAARTGCIAAWTFRTVVGNRAFQSGGAALNTSLNLARGQAFQACRQNPNSRGNCRITSVMCADGSHRAS